MRSINIDTIKSDLEEHKKLVDDIKIKNKNEKKNYKSIRDFVDTIELF